MPVFVSYSLLLAFDKIPSFTNQLTRLMVQSTQQCLACHHSVALGVCCADHIIDILWSQWKFVLCYEHFDSTSFLFVTPQ